MTTEQSLTAKDIRPTAMRILVYKVMQESKVALALSDIEHTFEAPTGKASGADRTTLYRTLKTFEDKGIVHQIDDGTGVIKYALCEPGCQCDIEQDLHLHFHCTQCDETVCLTDRKIPHINLPDGFTAQDANLVVKGVCDHCNA